MAEVLYLGRGKRARGERDLQDPEDVGGGLAERNALNHRRQGAPPRLPENRKLHRQLLSWYYFRRDRQATNRLEMAIDADFCRRAAVGPGGCRGGDRPRADAAVLQRGRADVRLDDRHRAPQPGRLARAAAHRDDMQLADA